MSVPILLMATVDAEEEWDWQGPYPVEQSSVENAEALPRFQALCERYGVRPTYFATHAFVSDPRAREIVQALARQGGAEVGMHVHPWNTPPIDRASVVRQQDTFLHNSPRDVVHAKLGSCYDALVQSGIVPTSFRGGRYSTGGAIHEFLLERQFLADSSIVPFTTWSDEGAPNFRRRGLQPSRIEPSRMTGSALWEIPLTLGFTRAPFSFWARVFEAVETSSLRRLRLIGLAERMGLVRRVWLNFEWDPELDWKVFLSMLQGLDVPCVTLTVHSSSLRAGPGPYTRTESDVSRIFARIEGVFQMISELGGFEPVTVSEAALVLEARHQGCDVSVDAAGKKTARDAGAVSDYATELRQGVSASRGSSSVRPENAS